MNEQPSTADVPEQVIDSVDGWLLSSNELELTQHKVAQINARAAKRGFTGELKVVAEPEDFAQTIAGHRVITHGFRTTITGTAPCYEGWRFLGAVDGLGDEAILRLAPGVAEDLVSHADLRPGHCDHCHHARSRKHVMLVQHTTTGEIRHVGSTCLKDFLGWKTRPVLIWEDEITEQLERLSFGGPGAWSMRDVMVLAFAVTKVMGWASKAMCEGREDLIPTSTWVRALLNRESKAREVQDEVRDVMADAQAQADAARELLLQHTANATYGYLANLGALLRSDMVEAKHLALAVSSVAAYHHAVSTQAEREARQQAAEQRRELAQASQWLGEVGEKITIAGTITTKTFIAGDWNRSSSWLIVVQTAAGIAKTFTAARWADDVEVGDHVSLTGKVKSLDVYQEARQTLMTRCKLNAGAAAA